MTKEKEPLPPALLALLKPLEEKAVAAEEAREETVKEAKESEKELVKQETEAKQAAVKTKTAYTEVVEVSSLVDTAAKEKYGREFDKLTAAEKEKIIRDPNSVIIQESLTALDIHLPAETTSIQDVINILEKREIVPAVNIVNFDLTYNIEQIQTPETNKIHSLTTVERNIWDRPVWIVGDNGLYYAKHNLKNYMLQAGGHINIVVGGAPNTKYHLVIYDETNNRYYDWNTVSTVATDSATQRTNIVETRGGLNTGFRYYEGYIPETGKETVNVYIPGSSAETVYKVSFAPINQITRYADSLPIMNVAEKPDYIITQLPNTTTTIKIANSPLFSTTGGDLEISHVPGARLDLKESTAGKYTVALTVNSRKAIALDPNVTGGILRLGHLNNNSIVSLTDPSLDPTKMTKILDIDLIAKVENNVGKIDGTITLGKAGLRASEITIEPSLIFTQ
mgnify:CR=1 FL=1